MSADLDINFQKVIEALPDAIVLVNREGTIVRVNSHAEQMFGYPRQELLNHPVDLLLPERFRAGHVRQRLAHFANPAVRPMGKGPEIYGLRKDGREFAAEISLSPLEAGDEILVISSIRDISGRKKIEKALTEEKERLNVTIQSIGDAVITIDTEGRVIFLNRVAEILTGWGQAEAEGHPLLEIFNILHERTRMPYEDPVAKVFATGKIVEIAGPTLLISREGIERQIVDCAAPIRDPFGAIIGVVLVFRDVTGKRKMEDALLRSMKLESVGLLAGGIAHDFNNLLSCIIGTVDLIKGDITPTNTLSKGLDQIEKAAFRAKEIASRLINFTKKAAPIKRRASIQEVVKEAVGLAALGPKFPCDLIFSDPIWAVEVDAGQIIQVVQNLLINASHAMAGGGIISVSADNVNLNHKEALNYSLKAGNYIKVSVKDSGSGIPIENLDKIFDPYFTTKEKGTGLGLSNAYAILKKHHGAIMADSQVGAGSVFSFYLPALLEEKSGVFDTCEALHIRHQRVLILDDEPMIREITGDILKQIGYESVCSSNGEEVVDLYQRAKEAGDPFDAVILDLNIPEGVGGKETLARLKNIDPAVKAIILSGSLEDPAVAEFRKFGFSARLVKPYGRKELAKVLYDLLQSI